MSVTKLLLNLSVAFVLVSAVPNSWAQSSAPQSSAPRSEEIPMDDIEEDDTEVTDGSATQEQEQEEEKPIAPQKSKSKKQAMAKVRKALGGKDVDGTRALDRGEFETQTLSVSHYKRNGVALEVDPD